jgi:hypothetical protein
MIAYVNGEAVPLVQDFLVRYRQQLGLYSDGHRFDQKFRIYDT